MAMEPMLDEDKTRDELIAELKKLRERQSRSIVIEDERKQADKALQESQQMLQLVMDSIPQAIFWKDTDSVYLGCNKVLARDVGLKDPGEIIGKTDYDLSTTREQSESYRDYDRLVMSTDKSIHHILEQQRRPENKLAWLDTNKIPLHDSDGNVIGVLCTYEDITERKQSEEALRDSEKRFKQLIESSPMPMALYDKNETVEYLNDTFVTTFGYGIEDIPNVKCWWLLAYPDNVYRAEIYARWHKMVEEAMVEGAETRPIENNVTCKDGSVRVMEAIGSPIGDKILVTFSDITVRKKAEMELERTNRALMAISRCNETMIHALDESALLKDICNIIVEVGEYRMAWIGYAENDEARTITPLAISGFEQGYVEKAKITWADRERGRGPTGRAVRTKKPAVVKYVMTDPDLGPWRNEAVRMGYNSILGLPLIDDGRAFGVMTIYSEKPDAFDENELILLQELANNLAYGITSIRSRKKQEQAEEKVKLAYAYNRSLIEASLDPLVTIAPDGKITDVNLATETVTGYPREKLIGTDFYSYFTDPEKAKEVYMMVFQKGSVKDYPLEIRHRYGHITPVIYNATIYRDDQGSVIGVFAAARDVTERKRVEEALDDAKNQAEIYLDLMGHDINNLNQVGMGYLELALDSLNLDMAGRELIAKPLEALENSSKLIDKVRKIQQVSTGEPKLYEIDVARLLQDLIPTYTNMNGRDVTINYSSGCHCFVMANDLLTDVFSNILGNAIKHSSGPLVINVRVSKAEAVEKAYCKVTIEDNGTGIPDNLKKKLFSRFQRGNTKASGKGLGLYLVRSLVHYYHGYVWIEDRIPGDYTKGARFVVMIPVIDDAKLYEKFNNTKSS